MACMGRKPWETTVRIFGSLVEVRPTYLLNTCLGRYGCTSLLFVVPCICAIKTSVKEAVSN